MKNILIPTDFSDISRSTIEKVIDLIKSTDNECRILLVNTYMVQQTDPTRVIFFNDELRKYSKDKLEEAREYLVEKVSNPKVFVETASHIGSLSNVISNLLQKQTIDTVVVGANNAKLLLSVTDLMVEKQCKLLVI